MSSTACWGRSISTCASSAGPWCPLLRCWRSGSSASSSLADQHPEWSHRRHSCDGSRQKPGTNRFCGRSALPVGGVQHPVVVVLVEAEIDADAVAQAEQELELVVVGLLDTMLDARRRPFERAPQ